jgi:hypothetical protein
VAAVASGCGLTRVAERYRRRSALHGLERGMVGWLAHGRRQTYVAMGLWSLFAGAFAAANAAQVWCSGPAFNAMVRPPFPP